MAATAMALWALVASCSEQDGAGKTKADQQAAPSETRRPQEAAATNGTVTREPEAMAALDRMGASLRKLNSFEVKVTGTTEDVLNTGQKLQYAENLEIRARRPDRLRIDRTSARADRSLFYDGAKVTLYSPRRGYYASFKAPPTIRETIELAAQRHKIEMPLADLFSWGTNPELAKRISSAFRAGSEQIGGQTCDHFAFRQDQADWEVWIRSGTEALPCKLVITTTSDPSRPQYEALLDWAPSQAQPDSIFAFKPPPTARQIVFAADAPQVSKK